MAKYYRTVVSFLAFGYMPMIACFTVCSDAMVRLLLGRQWGRASELLQVLSVATLIDTVAATSGIVMITSGRTRAYFKCGVWQALLMGFAFCIGINWGALGLAWSYAACTYLTLLPLLWYSFRATPIQLADFFTAIWLPATSTS